MIKYYDRKDMSLIVTAAATLAAALGIFYAYVDISLNRMGQSAFMIGLNASMQALGWFLFAPFLPLILKHFAPRRVLIVLLTVPMIAALGFPSFPNPLIWLPLRFLFGGCIGLAFRLVEYQINAFSPDHVRTRNIGVYSVFFSGGAGVGAGIAPLVGLQGWTPILLIFVLLGFGGAVLMRVSPLPLLLENGKRAGWSALSGLTPIAITGAFVLGMFESVPYTLMPIYAIRSGIDENMAVWTASAYLLGEVAFPIPMGLWADNASKIKLLWLCGLMCLAIPAILPASIQSTEALLGLMFLWGGFAGSLYVICLAMLADFSQGSGLISANALFGTLYAAGGLAGPLYNGAVMDLNSPNGLMISAASLFVIFVLSLAWGERRRGLVQV